MRDYVTSGTSGCRIAKCTDNLLPHSSTPSTSPKFVTYTVVKYGPSVLFHRVVRLSTSFIHLSTSFYSCYKPHCTWLKQLASLCRSIKPSIVLYIKPSFCRLPSGKTIVTIQNQDFLKKNEMYTFLWPLLQDSKIQLRVFSTTQLSVSIYYNQAEVVCSQCQALSQFAYYSLTSLYSAHYHCTYSEIT